MVCCLFQMSKPLNPLAQEWRPSPQPPAVLPPPHYYYPRRPAPHLRRKALPPRMRRPKEAFPSNKPPLPQRQKQVWIAAGRKTSDHRRGASTSKTPISPENSSFTTLMIKNIPNKLRREFMLQFLDGYCKVRTWEYDFLYLPMDFRQKNNLGYAFVNFTTIDAANGFKRVLQNFKWKEVDPTFRKVCDITLARVQGKKALIRRFQNSDFTCESPEFLPVFFDPPRNGLDTNPPRPITLGRFHRSYH